MKADRGNSSGCVCVRSLHSLVHPPPHLLPLGVALKHKGVERGLRVLAAIAPVPVLHHESHQSGVFLVRSELAHLSQLELWNEWIKPAWSDCLNFTKRPDLSFKKETLLELTPSRVTWVWGSINLERGENTFARLILQLFDTATVSLQFDKVKRKINVFPHSHF